MNETVLPRAILISKETGQMIEATPLTEITPKPWPIDDIETETEPEPPKSLTLSGTFTLKTKMKANQRRKLIRALSGKQKLPRKLKKALKHVGFFQLPMERVETENGVAFKQTVGFGPKDGYPCTKWVNRACLKLKAQAIYIIGRQISAENYKQRGPHSYLLPPTSYLTTEQLKNSKLK